MCFQGIWSGNGQIMFAESSQYKRGGWVGERVKRFLANCWYMSLFFSKVQKEQTSSFTTFRRSLETRTFCRCSFLLEMLFQLKSSLTNRPTWASALVWKSLIRKDSRGCCVLHFPTFPLGGISWSGQLLLSSKWASSHSGLDYDPGDLTVSIMFCPPPTSGPLQLCRYFSSPYSSNLAMDDTQNTLKLFNSVHFVTPVVKVISINLAIWDSSP